MNFHVNADGTFDGSVPDRGLRGSRNEIFPILSRANNIGFERGIHAHVYSPDQMRDLQYIHCWAGGCRGEIEESSLVTGVDANGFSELEGFDEILSAFQLDVKRV